MGHVLSPPTPNIVTGHGDRVAGDGVKGLPQFGIVTREEEQQVPGKILDVAGRRVIEPFSSCVCLADLQHVNSLGELPGAPRAAA